MSVGKVPDVFFDDKEKPCVFGHRNSGSKSPFFLLLKLENKSSGSLLETLYSGQLRRAEALLYGYVEVRSIHRPMMIFKLKILVNQKILFYLMEISAKTFFIPWSKNFDGPDPVSYGLSKELMIE